MTNKLIKICGIVSIFLLSGCGGSSGKKAVEVKNRAPTALIELDASIIELGSPVILSGTSSNDPDDDTLSYEWNIKTEAGADYPLPDTSLEAFTFTPEHFGTYKVTLVVRDAELTSEPVTTTITVEPNEQNYPIAMVSNDINSKTGQINWFNAENSRAYHGQLLTYLWEVKSKPATSNSVIGNGNKFNAYLITDVTGTYEVSLTVTNAENKLTATKTITIKADDLLANSAPMAIISRPLPSYAPNQTVRLNASASYDRDSDDLTYQWQLALPSTAHYSSLAGDTTEFVEVNVDGLGEYELTLTVTDGLLTHKTTQIFTITDKNIAPIANAGSDKIAAVGAVLEINGVESSDPDGDAAELSYQWSLVSKPSESNYDGLSTPTFIGYSTFPFVADVAGEYVLALQAFDGTDYSAVDHLYIEVTDNQRPVAILPNDVIVHRNGSQALPDTQSFDPEGQSLSYLWKIVSVPTGSTGRLLSPNDMSGVIVLSDFPGTYTVQLIVNDGIQDSFPATMSFVYTAEEFYELTATGRLVDEAGLPLVIAEIGGILHAKTSSDDNGNFEVLLQSRNKDALLTVLTLADESILSTILRIPKTEEQQVDLGTVKLPILQSTDIFLTACEGYNGPEKVSVNFYLSSYGYENMKFPKPVSIELLIDQVEATPVKLPATGTIGMFSAAPNVGMLSLDNGESSFINEYQESDEQKEPLTITFCN